MALDKEVRDGIPLVKCWCWWCMPEFPCLFDIAVKISNSWGLLWSMGRNLSLPWASSSGYVLSGTSVQATTVFCYTNFTNLFLSAPLLLSFTFYFIVLNHILSNLFSSRILQAAFGPYIQFTCSRQPVTTITTGITSSSATPPVDSFLIALQCWDFPVLVNWKSSTVQSPNRR